MAMIELVDFNEIYGRDAKEEGAKKTRRSRRTGAKKAETTESFDATATAVPVAESEAPEIAAEPATEENTTPEAPAQEGTEEEKA
jgi:large subunit ribosomal protein L17